MTKDERNFLLIAIGLVLACCAIAWLICEKVLCHTGFFYKSQGEDFYRWLFYALIGGISYKLYQIGCFIKYKISSK